MHFVNSGPASGEKPGSFKGARQQGFFMSVQYKNHRLFHKKARGQKRIQKK
jgi:hypothetical protein